MRVKKPDFERLRKVIMNDGEPDIVPIYEGIIDYEIIKMITGKPYSIKNYVEFFYEMGYDYVISGFDYRLKYNYRLTEDNAFLPHSWGRSYPEQNISLINNREELECYPWPEISDSILRSTAETIECIPDGMKVIISNGLGVLETIMLIMGYTPFSYALYEDEQLVWDIIEKASNIIIDAIRLCFDKLDMDKIGAVEYGDDMGFKTSTMISPEHLRKFIFPRQKKIAELVHNHDMPLILHSCGKLDDVMDDLIDDVGIDAKHSYEDIIMPVIEFKKKYGSRIGILGGVDVNAICSFGENKLRNYIENIFRTCSIGGGFALGTGNSVANYVPPENYLIMIDEWKKLNNMV